MPRASYRRSSRSRLLRISALILAIALFIDTLSLISTYNRSTQRSSSYLTNPGPNIRNQRIFIASTHWNNERVIRSHWSTSVINLVHYFGAQNIYISIYESGSWDNTKAALRELDTQLAALDVPRTIILDERTHQEELAHPPSQEGSGWISPPPNSPKSKTQDGQQRRLELRRIPYLARLRNLSLKPLFDLEESSAANATENNKAFDKILFLNDVVFTTADIRTLLATRDGDYAAACSLDFQHPPSYYDTFALRDIDGHEAASPTYPYFRSPISRAATLRGEVVPVRSCWNGITVFDAAPFYKEGGGLRFRSTEDGLGKFGVEGSECCLVHTDNKMSGVRGVWVNTAVRVGYSGEAYKEVHAGLGASELEGEGEKKAVPPWPGSQSVFRGVWSNRYRRWTRSPALKERRVRNRVSAWKKEGKAKGEEREEKGLVCLINEMQVLRENGWAHL